jgi:hypothetical protein
VLYVADTNNHSVRIIDVATGSTSTLILKGIEAFDPPSAYRGELVTLDPLIVSAGQAALVLEYELPDGYKVNEEAPSSVVISAGASLASFPDGDSVDITGTPVPVEVPIQLMEGIGTLRFDVTLIYCEAVNTTLCLIDQVRYSQPVEIGPPGTSDRIVLERTIRRP